MLFIALSCSNSLSSHVGCDMYNSFFSLMLSAVCNVLSPTFQGTKNVTGAHTKGRKELFLLHAVTSWHNRSALTARPCLTPHGLPSEGHGDLQPIKQSSW